MSESQTLVCTSVGNAGIKLVAGGRTLIIDAPVTCGVPDVADPPYLRPDMVDYCDVLLFTHTHPDHFHPPQAAQLARKTGCRIGGPPGVLRAIPEELRLVLSPGKRTVLGPGLIVTALPTHHGAEHWSWLLELGDFRILHDGDNEKTRLLDQSLIGPLDLLCLAGWKGSGWEDCLERLKPRRTLLIHLVAEERRLHRAGEYLSMVTDKIVPSLEVLEPGTSLSLFGRNT